MTLKLCYIRCSQVLFCRKLNFTIFLYVDKEFIYIPKRNTEQKKTKTKQNKQHQPLRHVIIFDDQK